MRVVAEPSKPQRPRERESPSSRGSSCSLGTRSRIERPANEAIWRARSRPMRSSKVVQVVHTNSGLGPRHGGPEGDALRESRGVLRVRVEVRGVPAAARWIVFCLRPGGVKGLLPRAAASGAWGRLQASDEADPSGELEGAMGAEARAPLAGCESG